MNLTNSILTTAVIVAAIWLLVLLQPSTANAISSKTKSSITNSSTREQPKINVPQVTQPIVDKLKSVAVANTPAFEATTVSGLTKTIQLANIGSLWTQFHQDSALTSKLTRNPKQVFVLYQNISSDFQQAQVTIGFDVTALRNVNARTVLPKISELTVLLAKGKYSEQQLAKGWGNIDYARGIKAVLEVHYLDSSAQPEATQLFVKYR
ncbi:MAG: hypothetical protein ACPGUD_08370 [Parashewanella sp.]